MKLHNPLPQSVEQDLVKCSHILKKFTKRELATTSQTTTIDKFIPKNVISNAKGIAIMTVLKVWHWDYYYYGDYYGNALTNTTTTLGWFYMEW